MSEKEFKTKDSGQRQEFETGSRRDTREGKGRFDLIPTLPLRRLAGLYERGAQKYGDRNWERGQPLMRYVDSAMRHLNNLLAGEPVEDHAISVAWNMFGFVHTLAEIEAGRLPRSLDDRPPPEPQYVAPPKPEEKPAETKPKTVEREGRTFHVDAHKAGGCLLCGGMERENLSYAHALCWQALPSELWHMATSLAAETWS